MIKAAIIRATTTRQGASDAIVQGLTGLAFASSYAHGVAFAKANHGGEWSYAYAAIPEALLGSALLQDKRDWRFWTKLAASVAWTFGVNLAGAFANGGSAGTLIVALMAPLAAVLCAFTGHSAPKKRAGRKSGTVAVRRTKPNVVEAGIKWASRQDEVPSVEAIKAARKCSLDSAKKIRAGALAA